MTAKILDGNAFLEHVKADLKQRVEKLAENGIIPSLATSLVGDDPNSASYIGRKVKNCEELGIGSPHSHLVAETTQLELNETIRKYNEDNLVDAILVQLPLPKHLNEEETLLTIDPEKDADGLHPVNLGRLVMGVEAPVACTPAGIQALLAHNGVEIAGKNVVIVGRGLTIGRPLANLLTLKRDNANAAVTVVHTGVPNIADYTREADIVIAAAGSPSIITKDMVKPGAAVVSAGITWGDGKKLIPDVAEDVAEVAGAITPRLGGVGPTTIAMLLTNCVAAAERRASRQ